LVRDEHPFGHGAVCLERLFSRVSQQLLLKVGRLVAVGVDRVLDLVVANGLLGAGGRVGRIQLPDIDRVEDEVELLLRAEVGVAIWVAGLVALGAGTVVPQVNLVEGCDDILLFGVGQGGGQFGGIG
jgi:hypothetical protein